MSTTRYRTLHALFTFALELPEGDVSVEADLIGMLDDTWNNALSVDEQMALKAEGLDHDVLTSSEDEGPRGDLTGTAGPE